MKQLANTCNGFHVDIASSLEHLLDLCRDFLSIIRIFLQNNAGLLSTTETELRLVTGFSRPYRYAYGLNRLKVLFVLFYVTLHKTPGFDI